MHGHDSDQKPSRWMTVDEAADYLRCGERYLRELLANDQVPHTMFAGKALFHSERLDAWLLSRETAPPDNERTFLCEEKTMIEADMERLIRDYPEEFFDEPLRLVSQQENFPSGITDLIFEDSQGDLLVIELKRGVLQREHIAQVIDYLGDVEKRYAGKNVELMVVAHIIPPQRRTKLERLGVSFKEIPEARFREVASKHGVQLAETAGPPGSFADQRVPIIPDCPRDRVGAVISELISFGERFVSGLGRELRTELENSDYRWISTKAYARLSRWCHPKAHTRREHWVLPRAHQLSQWLFGRLIERTLHPSYGS